MKKIFFLLLLLSAFEAYAQQNLIGVWKASCPVHYKTRTTIKHCELCPTLLDSTGTHLTVQDFDFIVEQGSLTLTMNVSSGRFNNASYTGIDYTWDKEKHVLSFSLLEKKYNFTAYYDDENIVLLNDDGTMVLLKRKEVQIVR